MVPKCHTDPAYGGSQPESAVEPLNLPMAWRISSGPTPGTANATEPWGPEVSTTLNRLRLMLRSPGPPGRLTSSTRSRVGIGITSLRCRQYRFHVIPVGPIVSVPCVNDRGKPGAWPLKKQLTIRDSPPSRATKSICCFDSAVPEGSVTVSNGWRNTSSRVREPPALRGLLTQSGCHSQRFRVLHSGVLGYPCVPSTMCGASVGRGSSG
jgi:hypothetical protein